jgi:hypothetical protein
MRLVLLAVLIDQFLQALIYSRATEVKTNDCRIRCSTAGSALFLLTPHTLSPIVCGVRNHVRHHNVGHTAESDIIQRVPPDVASESTQWTTSGIRR